MEGLEGTCVDGHTDKRRLVFLCFGMLRTRKAKVFPECPFLQPFPSNLLMEGSVKSISTNQRELVGSKFYFPKPGNL